MSIVLRIDEGDGQHSYFEAAETIVLGRDKRRVHVFLNDDFVSREHATIQRRKDGQWHFIHRGRNASRLDDRFLEKPGEQMVLHDKSIVQVGRFRIQCLIDEEPATEIIASRFVAIESGDILSPADDELFSRADDDNGLDDDNPLLQDTQVAMSIPSLDQLHDGGPHDGECDGFPDASEGRSRPVQLHTLAQQALVGPEHEASLEAPIPSEPVGLTDNSVAAGGYETLDMSEHILEHQRLMQDQAEAGTSAPELVAPDALSGTEPALSDPSPELFVAPPVRSESVDSEAAESKSFVSEAAMEAASEAGAAEAAVSAASPTEPVNRAFSAEAESGDSGPRQADQPSQVGVIPLNLHRPMAPSSFSALSDPSEPSSQPSPQTLRQAVLQTPGGAAVPGAPPLTAAAGGSSPVLPAPTVPTPWYLHPFLVIIAWFKSLLRR